MISKIKVTKEQASALEGLLASEGDKSQAIDSHAEVYFNPDDKWVNGWETLNSLPPSDLARALLIGYEVEPEYKIGDWVVSREGHFGEVDRVEGQVFHGRWFNEKGRVFAMRCGFTDFKRLATPKEIKAEKERHLWAEDGDTND